LICTVMERSIPPDLVGFALLRFFANSSYWYKVNVPQIQPLSGVITLVDSCWLSVSTMVG